MRRSRSIRRLRPIEPLPLDITSLEIMADLDPGMIDWGVRL